MFDEVLNDTYYQYKTNTAVVAAWLKNTVAELENAQKTPHRNDRFTPKKQSLTPRGKGARSNESKTRTTSALGPQQPAPTSESDTTKQKYDLETKDWILSARRVADSSSAATIPDHILEALDLAIEYRHAHRDTIFKQLARGVNWLSGKLFTPSDQSHLKFIQTLQEVRQILVAVRPVLEQPKSTPPPFRNRKEANQDEKVIVVQSSPKSKKDSGNRYAQLQTDDFTENSDGGIPSQGNGIKSEHNEMGCPTEHDASNVMVETPEVEAPFAFWCLFKDLNDLLDFVAQTWSQYCTGALELEVAAVIVNTSIALARSLEENISRQFPDHFQEMLGAYLEDALSKSELDLKWKEDPNNEGLAYGGADESFLKIYRVLISYPKKLHNGHKSADHSMDDEIANQYFADRVALLDFLHSLENMTTKTDQIPAEDEFTKASRQFLYDRKISIWYLYAANAYIICRRLDESFGSGLWILHTIAKVAAATIHEEVTFRRHASSMGREQKSDEVLKFVTDDLRDWALEDPSSEYQEDLPDQSKISARADFLSTNPVLCGLILLRIRMVLHDEGVGVANEWSTIQHAGHLYSAMQQEKLLAEPSIINDLATGNHRWADMEFLFQHYGHSRFFYGARPFNPEGYFKQFSFTLGYSVTNFANHRRRLPARNFKQPKALDRLAPVSFMFRDCVVGTSARTNFDMADIQKVMGKVRSCKNMDEEESWADTATGENVLPDDIPSKYAGNPASTERLTRRQAETKHGHTPVQLLTELRAVLHSESIGMAFDFLRFRRSCHRLLLNITRELRPELEAAGPRGMYEQCELHLPITVGYIFITAADVGRFPGLDRARTWPRNSLYAMRKAARVMREEISKDGDLQVETLRGWGLLAIGGW